MREQRITRTWDLLGRLCPVPHTAPREHHLGSFFKSPNAQCTTQNTQINTSGGSSQASVTYKIPSWFYNMDKLRNTVPKRQSLGSLESWCGRLRHCCPFRRESFCQDPFPKDVSFVDLPIPCTSEHFRSIFLLSGFGYKLFHNVSSNIFFILSWWLSYKSRLALKATWRMSLLIERLCLYFPEWQGTQEILTKWRKERTHSIKNTVQRQVVHLKIYSSLGIFSRLPQCNAGDLFQMYIQVFKLTRISFSTIYWGKNIFPMLLKYDFSVV